jgi:TonB family protein
MIWIALLTAASAQTPPPLQPNGSWTVAYEESMCLASRRFGPGGEVMLHLRPSPLNDDNAEITFILTGSKNRAVVFEGKGVVTLQPGDQRIESTYKAWRSPSAGGRAIIVYADQDVMGRTNDGGSLSFTAPKETAISLSMRQIEKLKPVIEDCKKTVARHWGVDTAALERIAEPARPEVEPVRWVNTNDYPDDALRKGQSGVTTLLWTIGTDGRVADCKIIASSGVPSLDRASCSAITKRARYVPARDKSGQPVVSYGTRRIMWIVPR